MSEVTQYTHSLVAFMSPPRSMRRSACRTRALQGRAEGQTGLHMWLYYLYIYCMRYKTPSTSVLRCVPSTKVSSLVGGVHVPPAVVQGYLAHKKQPGCGFYRGTSLIRNSGGLTRWWRSCPRRGR